MTSEEERLRRAADRQARYRERVKLHGRGDHSKCLPDAACRRPAPAPADLKEPGGDAAEGVTRDVTAPPKNEASHRPPPADLGPAGRELWDQMAGFKFAPHHMLLLTRLCRKADRLEEMDEALRGRGWIHLVEPPDGDGTVVEVVVDKLLSEIRQTEIALKLDVAELRHAGRPAAASPAAPPAPDPVAEGGAEGGKHRGLASIRGGLDTTG
ncbi:MAG TPA: hypothetical protein VGP26_24640 [Actinophytocola sp.]|jgi:hypothetical protein|nr:hypothetical protein [Actinophytocola sp.]